MKNINIVLFRHSVFSKGILCFMPIVRIRLNEDTWKVKHQIQVDFTKVSYHFTWYNDGSFKKKIYK